MLAWMKVEWMADHLVEWKVVLWVDQLVEMTVSSMVATMDWSSVALLVQLKVDKMVYRWVVWLVVTMVVQRVVMKVGL